MYKPLCSISKRHKRRLKQQAMLRICNFQTPSPPCMANSQAIEIFNENLPGPSHARTSREDDIPMDKNIPDLSSDEDTLNDLLVDTDSETDYTKRQELNYGESLHNDLREWATKYNVGYKTLSSLLGVLNKNNINVPLDARTLLKVPRTVDLGLKHGIVNSLNKYFCNNVPSELKVDVSVDGLPLSKSSGSQYWPILGAIINDDCYTEPFVIGIYHGNFKPSNANQLLKQFVDEASAILKKSIEWNNKKIVIKINAFICDAPARAFIAGVKSHTGYFGCMKCIQEGDFINNRMTFPELHSPLRTDAMFQHRMQEEHHRENSILESLDIGMVSQMPVEYPCMFGCHETTSAILV